MTPAELEREYREVRKALFENGPDLTTLDCLYRDWVQSNPARLREHFNLLRELITPEAVKRRAEIEAKPW